MKRLALFALAAAAILAANAAHDTTNTVMMVNQRGELNVEGVASVADVATNAVKVQIAEAKAEAAQATAEGVTNAISAVVGNIMSNNVVIYRSGFSDSFASLVIFTENDLLAIIDARWQVSAAQIVVEVDYVTTANLGTVKPLVFCHNSLEVGRANFDEVPNGSVTTPVYHAGAREYNGDTFAGYYTTTATLANPSSTSSYFLWIKAEADTPSGDGTTLDLPHGVTGGATETVTWGDKVLTFRGGVLVEVTDAE